ncbi:hypothetical protein EIK77_008658 [Talaromyces pinophilus]|nr:hypothetical protein EIK77_008658 [Talaromyces pinophilus]
MSDGSCVPLKTLSLKQNCGVNDGELTENDVDILPVACSSTSVDFDCCAQNHFRLIRSYLCDRADFVYLKMNYVLYNGKVRHVMDGLLTKQLGMGTEYSPQQQDDMPELAEVARIVHFIRKHLVGKTLANVQAQNDDIVYGKAGTSAAEFQKTMQGNKIVGAGQQGKYFWITMSKPPHVVMHFGMTGWMKIKNADTYYYRTTNADDKDWPPKYWKFLLETDETPKTEAAFVDPRRLARVRLVDCPADDIRQYTPLKENGPDPVTDKDILTIEWLQDKIKSKKVPIKALLLDQANISGIGNWMG